MATPVHIPIPDDVKARFWAKVAVRGSDDCWYWLACCSAKGYGRFGVGGIARWAHRISWVISNERSVPDGLEILHSCDHPGCVNPHHLSVGTRADNMQDMLTKGRENRLKGERHPRAKLSEGDVVQIRASGLGARRLAKAFGVDPSVIQDVKNRIIWKHVR